MDRSTVVDVVVVGAGVVDGVTNVEDEGVLPFVVGVGVEDC